MTLFHEIYGIYFQVVAAVLAEAVDGTLTEKRLLEIVRERAFAESVLTIPAALRDGSWPLLDPSLKTPVRRRPEMPLTTLEKRWMKAALLDPRVALFSPPAEGLEDVEPLFSPETFVYFDRYGGDPYDDPGYIARFHTVLTALREHRRLRICFQGRTGRRHTKKCVPLRLEYSGKDDKFRLLILEKKARAAVNLARMEACTLLEEAPCDPAALRLPEERKETLVLRLQDRRNALERALLHFSHFEKETVRLEEDCYQITLRYQREDEAELLIRVLSFGPMLRVTAPARMVAQVRQRVERQWKWTQENQK